MLERIIGILERARVAGGWIDEDVARAVLTEMREPTEAMLGAAEASYEVQPRKVWRAMCVAALNETPYDGKPVVPSDDVSPE